MTTKTEGGCQCGAVRFAATGDALFCTKCHCRDCQRISGGAYLPMMAYASSAVAVTGEIKHFERRSDNGLTVTEIFCARCGAHFAGKAEALPDVVLLLAGALDDPGAFKPQMDIFTASAQPWDHMDPALPKFPGMQRAADHGRGNVVQLWKDRRVARIERGIAALLRLHDALDVGGCMKAQQFIARCASPAQSLTAREQALALGLAQEC